MGAATASFLRSGARPRAQAHDAPHEAGPAVAEAKQGFLLGVLNSQARKLEPRSRLTLVEALLEAEREHAIDALLLLAVIDRESSFNPRARSRVGALGLMQVRPFTAREVALRRGWPWRGAEQLYEPVFNVQVGAAYLEEMRRRFDDDWTAALAAYNAGPSRVKRHLAAGRQPPRRYARRVLSTHENLLESFTKTGVRKASRAG